MQKNFSTSQKLTISDNNIGLDMLNRKQSRIELRALRDAIPLRTVSDSNFTPEIADCEDLQRTSAFAIADRIEIRELFKDAKKNLSVNKVTMYQGECLYMSYKFDSRDFDLFVFDYGVVVFWGLTESQEEKIVKMCRNFAVNAYINEKIETEYFKYGVVKDNPMINNDVFYLANDEFFNKLVVSCAIAQSVRLDCFEDLVEQAVAPLISPPLHLDKLGIIKKSGSDIAKLTSKLHALRFNLNIVSNILDTPDILWHYPSYSSLYETVRRYLDIQSRADILNQRVDVIKDFLQLFTDNIAVKRRKTHAIILFIFLFLIFAALVFIGGVLFFKKKQGGQ